jgi:TonB family protein
MCIGLFLLSKIVDGQSIIIKLHFYGPLSANRASFEDRVMTFYDVYTVSKKEIIPSIYLVREDYSNWQVEQTFNKPDGGKTDFRDRVKDIKNPEWRSKIQPNPMLLKPYGICQYQRPSKIEESHFYLGKTTVPSKHQYATCRELKMALQHLMDSVSINAIDIHFISSVDDDYKDSKYEERTFPYIGIDFSGKPILVGDAANRLSIFSEGFTNEINGGNVIAGRYFGNGTVRIGDSLNVLSSQLNEYFFQNRSFSKLHFIYKKKSLEFIGFELGVLSYSFWTEVECYRPEINKYEFRLVKMKVGLDQKGKIVSLRELESLGKTLSESNTNPRKVVSRGSSPPPPPETPSQNNPNEVVSFASEEPSYLGGMDKLYRDLDRNLVYPQAEKNAGVSGTVYVSFIVEWDGSISNILVDRAVENGKGLSKAATDAVSKLGFFRPAQLSGQSVRYRYVLPVRFALR